MVPQIPFLPVLYDMLGGLGIGVMLAICFDLLRLFLPHGKTSVFFLDILIFIIAAIWLFSYAVSISHTGILRWYITGSALLGYLSYLRVISPCTTKIIGIIHIVVMLPFRILKHYIMRLAKFAGKYCRKIPKKTSKKRTKKDKKTLHYTTDVLYNSN